MNRKRRKMKEKQTEKEREEPRNRENKETRGIISALQSFSSNRKETTFFLWKRKKKTICYYTDFFECAYVLLHNLFSFFPQFARLFFTLGLRGDESTLTVYSVYSRTWNVWLFWEWNRTKGMSDDRGYHQSLPSIIDRSSWERWGWERESTVIGYNCSSWVMTFKNQSEPKWSPIWKEVSDGKRRCYEEGEREVRPCWRGRKEGRKEKRERMMKKREREERMMKKWGRRE